MAGQRIPPDIFEWRRPRLDDPEVTKSDPNSLEAVAFADTAKGMSGEIAAGTATPDPGDCLGWTWPAYAVDGRRLTEGDVANLYNVLLHEIVPPALTGEDVIVYVGLADRANLAAAGLNAMGVGIVYTGGNRVVRVFTVAAGVAATSDETAPDTSSLGVLGTFARGHGDGEWFAQHACGLETGGAISDTQFRSRADNIDFGTSDMYWFLAFGRDSIAGAQEALEVQPRFYGIPSPRGGLAEP